jgi:hypothetical protein
MLPEQRAILVRLQQFFNGSDVFMSVHLQMGIDYSGNIFALEELYQTNQLLIENALAIRNLVAIYGKQTAYLYLRDEGTQRESEKSSIQSAYARGCLQTVIARKTATDVGIDLIKEHLRADPKRLKPFNQDKGFPKLFISKQGCPNLWREMIGLRTVDGNGKIEYIGVDYAVSALRTVLMARPTVPSKKVNIPDQPAYLSPWS